MKYNEFFKITERSTTKEKISVLVDEAPSELEDLVRYIHDHFDAMPNDWIYSTIHDAFNDIEESYVIDVELDTILNDIESDVYTHDLIEWLHNPYAITCIEEASHDFITDDFTGMIRHGQLVAKIEIYTQVYDFIHKEV